MFDLCGGDKVRAQRASYCMKTFSPHLHSTASSAPTHWNTAGWWRDRMPQASGVTGRALDAAGESCSQRSCRASRGRAAGRGALRGQIAIAATSTASTRRSRASRTGARRVTAQLVALLALTARPLWRSASQCVMEPSRPEQVALPDRCREQIRHCPARGATKRCSAHLRGG